MEGGPTQYTKVNCILSPEIFNAGTESRKFYEDCRLPFSKIPLGTVWFLAKTVLFFPRHVLLQLITDLDESSQNRCKDMFSLIGNGQSVIDRCIAVLTLSQRHTAICK